jgi:hypothetical protein
MRINEGIREFDPLLGSGDDDVKEGLTLTHLEFGRI